MIGIAFAAATLFAVGAGTSPAKASAITGGFSISGADSLNLATDQIGFIPGTSTIVGITESGSFATVFGGASSPVTMFNEGALFNYNTQIPVGAVFVTGTVASGLTFTTTALPTVTESATGVIIDLTGTFHLAGFDNTLGTLHVSGQIGGATVLTFSASAAAVPAPIMGAGLPGLVAACGGLLALVRRRRQKMIA
jgi:hypothetical protein